MSPSNYTNLDFATADCSSTITTATKKELLASKRYTIKALKNARWYQFGKKKRLQENLNDLNYLLNNRLFRRESEGGK